jgi:hypothetical protein
MECRFWITSDESGDVGYQVFVAVIDQLIVFGFLCRNPVEYHQEFEDKTSVSTSGIISIL